MKLQIDAGSGVPIYIQIGDEIHAQIAAGQLKPEEQLPTIRELAADLRVNLNTVARAYLELDREGVISTQRGRGTFVSGTLDQQQVQKRREKKLDAIVRNAIEEAVHLGYETEEIEERFQRVINSRIQQDK